jgi:hypothetical protein
MIMNERIAEGLLRFELLKTNPDLVAKLDEDNRRQQEEYFLSLLGPEGSIKRFGDGAVMLYSPNFVQRSKPIPTQKTMPVTPTVKPQSPAPSDYTKLLVANSRRRSSFIPSKDWHEKRRELCRFIERNNRPQVALSAAEIASLELGITRPHVRVWTGHEKEAEKKAGWVWGNKYEINICLNTEGCKSIALTAAHEVKHVQQFARFPNLTSDQREDDARTYQKEFGQRVFADTGSNSLTI